MEQESEIGGEMIRTEETKVRKVRVTKAGATKETRQRRSRVAVGEGADMMTALADRKLRQEGRKILDKVATNAKDGNVPCTRLLMDLSEKFKQRKACGKKRKRVGLASMWSAEPEWRGESSEAEAETASGSREPEG